MKIIQKYIPVGTKRRSGNYIKGVAFIVAHDTGNPESTALGNVNYYIKSANEESASAHAFVDDIQVVECLPHTEKAWHVRYNVPKDNEIFGMDANDWALGIELCYFPSDLERTKKAYENYVQYIASLVTKNHIDAKTHIVGHYLLDPSRRTDPLNAFQYLGKDWADFENDIDEAVHGRVAPSPKEEVHADEVPMITVEHIPEVHATTEDVPLGTQAETMAPETDSVGTVVPPFVAPEPVPAACPPTLGYKKPLWVKGVESLASLFFKRK